MAFLEYIDSPADLKCLSRNELEIVAKEIRKLMVETVSKTGGHLAPSLGAVEIAIAIHYVFDSPMDKIIWDVGHQAYAHKILTGRNRNFDTLRKHGGISGFTRISESLYDGFTTGHSSTSISAGLGIACAKRLKKQDSKVVAVIGDGSMTGGLAYEGLNAAGDIHKGIIVILNDNDMSISRNVGALSSFLSRKYSTTYLQNLRKEFGIFLKSLPKIGDYVYKLAKRSEESLKTFGTPGMLFEAFNFEYFGPIDGHNLDHLIDILENIKNINEPVLLHIKTKKGKGYGPAEKNPIHFHGIGSFDIKTGTSVSKNSIPSYTEVFGNTMIKLAKDNPKIIAITAAMPEGTGLTKFGEIYPDRLFDVGIAEAHGVTFAGGMATEGFKPVVAIYSTFLQRAYDQIVHDVCLESLPVVFAIDRAGIVGEDGPTHHGVFDITYLRSMPNMVIMAPKDENELCQMLFTAISYEKGPVALRYPRGSGIGVEVDENITEISIGKAEILKEGTDLLILAVGRMVYEALIAYSILIKEGISSTVVNCRFIKPIDKDLIHDLVKKIPNVITAEEGMLEGGFGSAVIESLIDSGITNFSLKRIGIKETFIEHGAPSLLRSKYNLDASAIVKLAKS
ncbi:MAG: 1-deoxy-D-xylulose-5-phosphate synthase [Desulfobacterales bacterium]|nr:1-deoxy-D-xylulose-5-phosphate synthase [Desulfobacterales bacterium]